MRFLNFSSTIVFVLFLSILPANAKMGFVGIGVSSLEESTKFYKEALGLKILGTYDNIEVDNSDGSKWYIDEVVLGKDEPQPSIVTQPRKQTNNRITNQIPIKIKKIN